jgi:hypothetical protein
MLNQSKILKNLFLGEEKLFLERNYAEEFIRVKKQKEQEEIGAQLMGTNKK